MKKQECKKIAKKIANLEITIQNASTEEEKKEAQNKLIELCCSFTDLSDMIQIDEEVQKILKNS